MAFPLVVCSWGWLSVQCSVDESQVKHSRGSICVSPLESGINIHGPISPGWKTLSHSTNMTQGLCLWVYWNGKGGSFQKRETNCGLGRASHVSLSHLVCSMPHTIYAERILSLVIWSSSFQSMQMKNVFQRLHVCFSSYELGMHHCVVLEHELYQVHPSPALQHEK